jgi:hypothetical protein
MSFRIFERLRKKKQEKGEYDTKRSDVVLRIATATSPNDLPSWEEIVKYGAWGDMIKAFGVLYTAHLELLKR